MSKQSKVRGLFYIFEDLDSLDAIDGLEKYTQAHD